MDFLDDKMLIILNGLIFDFISDIQSFPYENHCECYKKLASGLWPVLFTLTYFFSSM